MADAVPSRPPHGEVACRSLSDLSVCRQRPPRSDDDPGRLRAALAEVEAPWRRLAAQAAALALSPPGPDQARRLAIARATLARWAPGVAARTVVLRRRLVLAEQARADRALRPLLVAVGLPLRAPTRLLAPCADAVLQPPVDGPALTARAAAALGRTMGTVLAAAPGALVRAPAAGRVAYAAPFRRYGRIAIIEHGAGWTSVLTGLGRVRVRAGTRIEAGEPLGSASAGVPLVGWELLHRGRPVDATAMIRQCRA